MPTHATSSCDCSLCESVESSAIVQRMAEATRLAKELRKGSIDPEKERNNALNREPDKDYGSRSSASSHIYHAADRANKMPKGGFFHPKHGVGRDGVPGGVGKIPHADQKGGEPLSSVGEFSALYKKRAQVNKRAQIRPAVRPNFRIPGSDHVPNALKSPLDRKPNALSTFANPKAAHDAHMAKKKLPAQESALPMGHMIAALENIRTAMEERDFAQYSEAVQTLRGTLYAE